jgi:hypothetical protein
MLEADKSGSTRVDVDWGFEDDLDMLEACIFDYLEPSNAKPQATSGGASRKRKHSEMSVQ